MNLGSQISEKIQRIGSCDNITTDISVRLHIAHVKEAYQFNNKVSYIGHMLKHTDWCTSLDYMEETLSYLALQGWYNVDSVNVFNLLSAINTRRSTHRAHL
jgi:hypothetical protein